MLSYIESNKSIVINHNLVHSAKLTLRRARSSNGEVSIQLCSCSSVPSPVQTEAEQTTTQVHILFFDGCILRINFINFIRSRARQAQPMLTKVFYLSYFVFIQKQSLLKCPELQVSYLPSAVRKHSITLLLKLMLPSMTVGV